MVHKLLFIGGVGMQEIVVIALFILLFFGAKKIPDFMRSLGKGIREFKNGAKELKDGAGGEGVPDS